ncbi:MAG: YdhR family protein [Candidatus Tectomicrobia bacterium]|nr:YdhR family protein [Candidatus Tectomicrobia bacterium]
MITAIVTARIPKGMTYEKYLENTNKIAPRFQQIPGLIRKNFLFSEAQGLGGGVYLWEGREAAERCYAGVWRENFVKAFGVEPSIAFFDTPIVVDNVAGKVIQAA